MVVVVEVVHNILEDMLVRIQLDKVSYITVSLGQLKKEKERNIN